jgi:anthraniloyl-CoA monooxygenase
MGNVLLSGVLAGNRSAIARALRLIDGDSPVPEALAAELARHGGRAHVVGITGAPGAGKSSLINALLGELRRRGRSVAVVAVDPSSPVSGGALLGDRLRMSDHADDPAVFIRSLSSRGQLGGLSATTGCTIDVFDAGGFDVVIVETVGTGQSEVEIARFADTRIVLCAPGQGDQVQAFKAGILEIADILVVNKAELPQAGQTVADLTAMVASRPPGNWAVPVLTTVARTGEGVQALLDAVDAHASLAGRGRRLQRAASSRELPSTRETAAPEPAAIVEKHHHGHLPGESMRIVCVGGGPAGLYFALLMKKLNPAHRITVVERNRPYDTFGWGVVFSDATLENMRAWDSDTANAIQVAFNHWDDVELHFKGRTIRSAGHGFVGIGRKQLLNILQERCEALDVELQFNREVESDAEFPDADLIIAADGIFSKIRSSHEAVFKPDIVKRPNRYIWLGTRKLVDAFTFYYEKTEHGWFQAHVYKFDANTSTFIVECPEHVWLAHGLDQADQEQSVAFCEKLFAKHLDGHRLETNARHLRGSAWLNFQRVKCEQWWLNNGNSHVVLMGDAVHTAHFAIGSGTKLAFEDAIELTRLFRDMADAEVDDVLRRYQELRNVDVLRLQNAAWNAMEWFEVCGARYCDALEPEQFMYSLLTRSQRISHENLRLRDRPWLEGYERWFEARSGMAPAAGSKPTPPMFTPFKLRGLEVPNRVIVSPMAMYSACDGRVDDFHLVHFGARALGGAGLIFTEMTCVSAEARITPGCAGMYLPEHVPAWRRIVDFVHARSGAKIGIQLGHAGRKGATRLGWEGSDEPLEEGAWPLVSASSLPYLPHSQVPRELDRAGMARVLDDFVRATEMAASAGFDILEFHCAHGYLMSSFLSPLTNRRSDDYGGSIENRARFPLEVFRAIRAVWPEEKPISVRLSCHDWVNGGNNADDAVAIARLFVAAGADIIDCSSGQVWKDDAPVYGRMYQTPFADRIRNEVGVPTIAVGAIFEADHVNSIVAAGRADLCAVARPHLADPAWTLHEAARIGYGGQTWPQQYLSGRSQYETNLQRAQMLSAAGK